MTVTAKPLWTQAGGETAVQARRMTQALFGGRVGVVAATDCSVAQNGTPNMSINVAAGQVVVAGTESTSQGYYVVYNDAAVNLAVAASDPTNARVDLVVAKVQDSQYSGAVDAASIAVVTGTPAPTPVEPPLPANRFVLARIDVAAGVSSITSANITDRRGLPVTRRQLGESHTTATVNNSNSPPSTVLTLTVTIPPGLPGGTRIKVRGLIGHLTTPTGVGALVDLLNATSGGVGVQTGGAVSGGAEVCRYDDDPPAGQRTYTLTMQTTVPAQTVTARYALIEAEYD
ncbi:MAG TPA: hypothetical protein VIS06_15995 [Mycobacteriales bacterium]